MISAQLNDIFTKAILFTKSMHHEYVTIEHIFYTLLNNQTAQQILRDLGADIEFLKEEIINYIEQAIAKVPDNVEPTESLALLRVIDSMMLHLQASSQQTADIGDLLAALFQEKETYTYKLLEASHIQRVDVLEYISHNDSITPKEKQESNNSFLEQFTINLTQKAKEQKIDPVIGREKEIQRATQVLCRRKKNNPIFVGEAGVGKTAIAEALALNIVNKQVPKILQESSIFALDLGAMIAGTKYRGEFEKRLKGVLEELKAYPNAILFIDEIHTLVGAGSANGSMDAANQLKPALASGELKCMGATTFAEYKNSFEKDKALSRRFSKIDVAEPSIKDSYKILRGLKSYYESYHNVKYSNKALKEAVDLSKRYINDKFLPDKAIDIIDECGALFQLKGKKGVIKAKDIKKTIAKVANIPNIVEDELSQIQHLEAKLHKQVIGQEKAVTYVVEAIKRSKAGLKQPNKPIASFLFSGPTGVGKTELAKSLSKILGIHFERFDMSEYMEKHTISRLIGSPPGYVGFEQGGLLSEAIKKHPYTVLLLDEIEKAHQDLVNILLQIMDNGFLTDSVGAKINFENVILILTSNLGANSSATIGFYNNTPNESELKEFFTPEFRNRLDAHITFNPLSLDVIAKVVEKELNKLRKTLKKQKVTLSISQAAVQYIAKQSYSSTMGARPVSRFIDEHIMQKLSDALLFGALKNGGEVAIKIKAKKLSLEFKK